MPQVCGTFGGCLELREISPFGMGKVVGWAWTVLLWTHCVVVKTGCYGFVKSGSFQRKVGVKLSLFSNKICLVKSSGSCISGALPREPAAIAALCILEVTIIR